MAAMTFAALIDRETYTGKGGLEKAVYVDALIALAKAHNWPEKLVLVPQPAVAS